MFITEVGKPFPIAIPENYEGSNFEYSSTHTLSMIAVLDQPSKKECNLFRKGLLRFRFYEKDGMILPLLAFEDPSQFLLELPFNPKLDFSFEPMNHELYLYLVDQKTKILMGQRLVGLGPEFMGYLIRTWENNRLDPQFPQKWQEFMHHCNQKNVLQLWAESKVLYHDE